MDTLTHALSGALLARATAPRHSRIGVRARLAAGFVAAAFPDTDFVLGFVSPGAYLVGHRGVTHSLLLLPLWAAALAWIFARIDRRPEVGWRDYFGVCALGIGAHILGDVITSYGTMIYAPLSSARIAWGTTFIIDLWFSGIILAGLVAAALLPRSRWPATAAVAVLVGYVGLQSWALERAQAVGREFAARFGVSFTRIQALPRPVSPFNWMVVVDGGDRYHYAFVNLLRKEVPAPPGEDAGLIARLDAAYMPVGAAKWTTAEKLGLVESLRPVARQALDAPELAFFRWFAALPALYRIDRGNPSTCVWFEDLRFLTPGREGNPFRYGACREEGEAEWKAYRLLDDGRRVPAFRGDEA